MFSFIKKIFGKKNNTVEVSLTSKPNIETIKEMSGKVTFYFNDNVTGDINALIRQLIETHKDDVLIERRFTIPVGGFSKEKTQEQIAKLIADYREEVCFDDKNGVVTINDKPHFNYSKDYWFGQEAAVKN